MIRRIVGGVAVAGVAIFGGVGAMGDDTGRNDQGEIVEAGGVGAYAIQYGDCIQVPDETEVQSVEGVPCSTPHDAQAYDSFDVTGYDDFPGEAIILEEADKGCLARFEGFVGVPFDESELYQVSFVPLAEGWAQGDHEIQCFVVAESGQMTFDAENSRR